MSSNGDSEDDKNSIKLEKIRTDSRVTRRRKKLKTEKNSQLEKDSQPEDSQTENSQSEENSGKKFFDSQDNLNISAIFHLRAKFEILHDTEVVNESQKQILLSDPTLNLNELIDSIQNIINSLEKEKTPSEEEAYNWEFKAKMAMPIRDITKLIPEYDGAEKNLDIFVKKVNKLWQHIAEYEDHDKNQFMLVLQLKLTDKAAEAVQNNEFLEWDNVREELIEHITPHRNTEKSELKLSSIRQKSGEDIEAYAKRIQEALDTLNRSFPENEQNEVIKRENNRKARKSFENGLNDANLRSKAIAKGSADLKEAIDYIIEQELRFSELTPSRSLFCSYCKKNNHTIDQCRLRNSNQNKSQNTRGNQSNKKEISCFKCGKKGHYANECRSQNTKQNQQNNAGESSKDVPQNQNKNFTIREESSNDQAESAKQKETVPVPASSLSKMIRIEEIKSKN